MGRLFDAVAALCGLRETVTYEGQAAIELEAVADRRERGAYPMPGLDARPTIEAIVRDLGRVPVQTIAARFHNAVADATVAALQRCDPPYVLSGGVFQNQRLLDRIDLEVLTPRRLPFNDGGVAYGQAAVAAYSRRR
jgi:hydrogenase maturation protein HypF